jgi:SpoVK/Ycf46/Vps4 family AAA+-type ATPase
MIFPSGDGCLELALISPSQMKVLRKQPNQNDNALTFCLCQATSDASLTSVIVQIISSNTKWVETVDSYACTYTSDTLLLLHPILCLFLNQAAFIATRETPQTEKSDDDDDSLHVSIAPLPLITEFHPVITSIFDAYANTLTELGWCLHPLRVEELPANRDFTIHVSCIYTERCEEEDFVEWPLSKETIGFALEGRIIKEGSIILLTTLPYGHVIAKIQKIESPFHDELIKDREQVIAYRLASRGHYQFQIDPPPLGIFTVAEDQELLKQYEDDGDDDVPGYESLQKEIYDTLQVRSRVSEAAVSGVLLVGCSGVGKSRMARSVANRFRRKSLGITSQKDQTVQRKRTPPFKLYYVSVQDLIFQASSDPDLLQNILIPNLHDTTFWILDDLHLLESENDYEEYTHRNDVESLLVRNALVESIDRFHRSCQIIGVTYNQQKLPMELTKIGRLEKCIEMLPPTQTQRFQIWKRILENEPLNETDNSRLEWVNTLTSLTPGCVARDFLRACQNARTCCLTEKGNHRESQSQTLKWVHLRESVRTLIPSQLAELDVIKPKDFDLLLSDKEVHHRSFQELGGYAKMKKHLYRHVVAPWKYFLNFVDSKFEMSDAQSSLKPPAGVLFHGKSGTGKTQAALCLAASLQLPIIQIRAADVLDKWLGGSESLLRSLFAKARSASPCILFLDEIDALASNREEGDTNDYSSRILSTLLNEMDGVSTLMESQQVLVLACTNRIGSLDAALLRPGRLEEHIFMSLPTVDDLEEILKVQLDRIPLHSTVFLKRLARILFEKGATGADAEGLCREACMMSMRGCDAASEVSVHDNDFQFAFAERFRS